MKVIRVLSVALFLLAVPHGFAASAKPGGGGQNTNGQVTLILAPFRFHPVFLQPNNPNSDLIGFSAYDNTANPTNATSLRTTSKNTNLTVPVFALIKGLKTQVGTMTVSPTGALSFTGF